MSEAEKMLRDKVSGLYLFNNTNDGETLKIFRRRVIEAMELYATERVKAYKKALREAIEEEISKYLNQISVLEVDEIGYSETAATYALIVNTLRTTLSLLDSVNPPNK